MIYLAGKVKGRKWHIIPNRDNFYASDGCDHSEHRWGWGYFWDFDNPELREQVLDRTLEPLAQCDFLLAYLDTPDAFGSIAEIAYASAHQKICYVIIKVDPGEIDGSVDDVMHDAYWFVCHFQYVKAYTVENEKQARLLVFQILRDHRQGMSYQQYLHTNHWKETRKVAVERAGHKCQLCGKNNKLLNVHHNSYDNLWNETEQDLIVLCHTCHSKFHGKEGRDASH